MKHSSLPYTIGLTGTIASGKSTATKFFKHHNIDVISADVMAHELTAENTPALAAIAAHFGQTILTKDNTLNRRALRKKIMQHPDEKVWLEAYLHPQIRAALQTALKHVTSPYAVVEIPLLTRREDFPYLSQVLLLEVDKKVQLERLTARDQCSHDDAQRMIDMQPDQAIRRALADDIIQNNDDTDAFHQVLHALHMRYLTQVSGSSGIKN
jgi:dephospho-CoA kinase